MKLALLVAAALAVSSSAPTPRVVSEAAFSGGVRGSQASLTQRRTVTAKEVKRAFARYGQVLKKYALPHGPGTYKIGKGYVPTAELDPPGRRFNYQVFVYRNAFEARASQRHTPSRNPLYGVRQATIVRDNVLVLYRVGTRQLTVVREAMKLL